MQAHLDLLGLKRGASDDALKSAYRKLALKHHPDKPGGDAEVFKSITVAYEYVIQIPNTT